MPEPDPTPQKPSKIPPDCRLVRDIADILRAMGDYWNWNEEPTIACELLELSKTSRKLATKMRRRRPKL